VKIRREAILETIRKNNIITQNQLGFIPLVLAIPMNYFHDAMMISGLFVSSIFSAGPDWAF